MAVSYSYLKDKDFLKEIDNSRIKEYFFRFEILDFKTEKYVDSIQGKVSNGSISINGSSAIRRTVNLTCVVDEFTYKILDAKNLISINKKINIEIGCKNFTNKYTDYDIIWFPQGIFIISTASINKNVSGATLSLQLKDKMCMLNGECGGTLPAATPFHEVELEDGSVQQLTIVQIIRELVNHFGNEDLHRIHIYNLDEYTKQIYRWSGDKTLWLKIIDGQIKDYKIQEEDPNDSSSNNWFSFVYGQNVGYLYTDFVYPGELIGQAGETVVTILDKIKNMLGNYEYFYDIYGNFIFQEKKNSLNNSITKNLEELLINSTELYQVDTSLNKSIYNFDNNVLISSLQSNPNYANIKNDFIIWGQKNSADGTKLPIRYHLAIDEKPVVNIQNSYSYYKLPLSEDYPYNPTYYDVEVKVENILKDKIYEEGILPLIRKNQNKNLEYILLLDFISQGESDYSSYISNNSKINKIYEKYILWHYGDLKRLYLSQSNFSDEQKWLSKTTLENEDVYTITKTGIVEIRKKIDQEKEDLEKTILETKEQIKKFLSLYCYNEKSHIDNLVDSYLSKNSYYFNYAEHCIQIEFSESLFGDLYLKKYLQIDVDENFLEKLFPELSLSSYKVLQEYFKNFKPTSLNYKDITRIYKEEFLPYLKKYNLSQKEKWLGLFNEYIVISYDLNDNKIIYSKNIFYEANYDNIFLDKENYKRVIGDDLQEINNIDYRTYIFLEGIKNQNQGTFPSDYFTELKSEWPKIYNLEDWEFYDHEITSYDYFLDIINTDALAEYSISNIGKRTKVVNDNSINCLFEPQIPNFLIIRTGLDTTRKERNLAIMKEENYWQAPSIVSDNLSLGSAYNSAFEAIKELLHQHTNYNETISITAIPIFYLEPNSRITVNDAETNISGDYVINSMNISLGHGGNMTINASKAIERY